jgi:site-specific recombinase XerD
LIEAYKEHLRGTRGLREPTLRGYEWNVRLFARAALGDDPIDPARLSCADVVGFIASVSERLSPATMGTVRTALRSFFRYLRVEALCDQPLEGALPTIAQWRLSSIPRFLSDEQLQQVLGSLDTCSPYGLRDRAIVLCLATLGLRPGEVAALRLDDINWRAGTVVLRQRKTRRGALLPLPHEAGRAIVAYVREARPATDERRVFVQHRKPRRGQPISANAVSEVVARALRRANVDAPMVGAYVFRHTVASRMVRRGASLKEVADLLGHASLDSSVIYAKLDLPTLREVALPWPEATR